MRMIGMMRKYPIPPPTIARRVRIIAAIIAV
jgi:hypothetical protein